MGLKTMTIELYREELSDLYTICSNVYRMNGLDGHGIKPIVKGWMTDWAAAYQKHDRFYIVFDKGDILVLYLMMKYANDIYNLSTLYNTSPKIRIVKTLLNFIMRHEECKS